MTSVPNHPGRRWHEPAVLRAIFYTILALAAGWWLLGQLTSVLRPLCLAVLLSYVFLPYYSRLRQNRVPAAVALVLMAGASALILGILTLVLASGFAALSTEIGPLRERTVRIGQSITGNLQGVFPWLPSVRTDGQQPDAVVADAMRSLASRMANEAAAGVLEAATVGLYLLFLLLGAERLPGKVRAAYAPADADAILHTAGRINAAIISYLKAKVKASAILAVPVGLILAAFDVPFALFWAVLTFLCNFIPYVGPVLAYLLPVGFAFLQYGWGVTPVAVAILMVAAHVASATLVEPLLLGQAVGLNPLVVLAALALWGSLWGLPGMFLAIPLTAVMKLVLENLEGTRPMSVLVEA